MKAAILEQINKPLKVIEVDLPGKLQRGQVLVKIEATSICGAQIEEIEGRKGRDEYLPHLLGHEACGSVKDVGEGVLKVARGNRVVLHWRKGSGLEGEPPVYTRNGKTFKAGPIATFAEYAIVSENRLTPIDHDLPADFCSLLGCAFSTAFAVLENEAKPKLGHLVLVVGCGGLGLSFMCALRKFPVSVVSYDLSRFKRWLALSVSDEFYCPDWPLASNFVAETIIDTVGTGEWLRYLKKGGKYILVGHGMKCDEARDIPVTDGGGFNPDKNMWRYSRMFEILDWKKIITHRVSLDDINQGIQIMRDGKAGRVMIEMNQ